MNSMNIFVKVSASFLVGLGYASLSAHAAIERSNHQAISSHQQTSIALHADESKLVAENRAMLIKNGAFARRIAAKLGLTIPAGEIPTTGTPLEQNQAIILENQATFRQIADKVGATGAPMSEVNSTDPAEKNHQLLLVNKGIVVSILKKLGIKPTPPTLTGSFVQKNNILLKANAASLAKIGAKLGVQ
jgi:hypothetical protein